MAKKKVSAVKPVRVTSVSELLDYVAQKKTSRYHLYMSLRPEDKESIIMGLYRSEPARFTLSWPEGKRKYTRIGIIFYPPEADN